MTQLPRSKHIGLGAFGTYGDVGPMLLLARALAQRGHRITLWLNPIYAAAAADAHPNITVIEVGAPLDLEQTIKRGGALDPRHVWRQIYVPQHLPFFKATRARHAQAPLDLVLAHGWTLGVMMAAIKEQLPYGCFTLQPMSWMSHLQPPRYNNVIIPAPLRRPAHKLLEPALYQGWFVAPLKPILAEAGLPMPARRELPFRYFWQNAALHLGLWDPRLRPALADDPPNAQIIGALRRADDPNASHKLPAALLDFCRAERPWVMGLGSALPSQFQHIYKAIAAAVDEPLVLVGVHSLEALGMSERAHVRCIDFAPYPALFAHARGAIHHGGANTIAEALAASLPQCIIPLGNDMFDNAEHVERLGISQTLSQAGLKRRANITKALNKLNDPAIVSHAQQLAAQLRSPQAALEAAIEHIERIKS